MQEGGDTGEVDGEEDLEQLARQIEATNAEEKETRGRKKRRRRRRQQEMRERRRMLKEDLCWLESAMKRMENSLLGSKHATLADLEQEIEKEGPFALQQVLNQFQELRDRKLNIETELDQLSDGQHIADPTASANKVEPDLSSQESGRESTETVHMQVEQEQKKNLQQGQQSIEQVDKVEEERMYKDLAKVELEDVEEDETTNGYDELLTGWVGLTHPHPRNQKEDETDSFCEDREGNRPDEEAKQSRDNRKKFEQSLDQVVPCEKRKRWRKKVCWLCAAAKTDEGFDLHCCAGCRKAR